MSLTHSRGNHTARHWSLTALVVRDGLKGRQGSVWDINTYPVGALQSMGRFFLWAYMGSRGEKSIRIPPMAPISSYSVAAEVLAHMGEGTDRESVESRMREHHDLIRRIQAKYRLVGTAKERAELRRFLDHLVQLAPP